MFVVLFELFISLFYLFIVPILFSTVNFLLLLLMAMVLVLLLLLFVSGVIIFPLSLRAHTSTRPHYILFRCVCLFHLIFSDAPNGKNSSQHRQHCFVYFWYDGKIRWHNNFCACFFLLLQFSFPTHARAIPHKHHTFRFIFIFSRIFICASAHSFSFLQYFLFFFLSLRSVFHCCFLHSSI